MLIKLVLGLALVYSAIGHVCETFKNTQVEIEVYQSSGRKLVRISGCIERIQEGFNEEIVEKILVKDQNIPRLHKDTARNMVRLHRIKFENCGIGEVDVGAFRNLPRTKEILLVKNRIKKFAGETFGRGMPLEILDLSENLLQELESFKGLDALKTLNLKSNSLTNLPEDLLSNCSTLEEINVAWNKLSAIPKRLFINTPKLRHVDLRSNKFSTFNLQPVSHLQNLNNLFLAKNFLTSVSVPTTVTLNKLDLAANFLNSLPNSCIQNLNVKFLLLTGNPLLCNCVIPIKDMLSRSQGILKDLNRCKGFLPCVFPKVLRQDCLAGEVDEEATKRYLGKVANKSMEHCYNSNH